MYIANIKQESRHIRLATTLLAFPLILQVVVTLGLILTFGVGVWMFVLAFTLYVAALWFTKILGRNIIDYLIVLTSFILSIIIALFFQDFQWDSRWYHLSASLLMLEGWNPFYEIASIFTEKQIVYFPKGQWYINAVMIDTFNSIEAGKFTHLLYIIASFLVAQHVILNKIPSHRYISIAIAFVCALNPIALSQLPINYLDGVVASLITILILSLYGMVDSPSLPLKICAIIATVLLASVKTSAFVFAIIIWCIFIAYIAFSKPKLILPWMKILVPVGAFILIINFNPYITNFISKGNPIYPVLSSEKLLARPYFEGYNRFERFFISYSSSTEFIEDNVTDPWSQWKNPLIKKNVKKISYPPALSRTIGAFGPWFGFALLISILLIPATSRAELIVLFMIFTTTFVHDEGWHSRYCPQIWLVPLIVGVGVIKKKKAKLYIPVLFSLMIALASEMILFSKYNNLYYETRSYFRARDNYLRTDLIFDAAFNRYYNKTEIPRFLKRFYWIEKQRLHLSGHLKQRDIGSKSP